VGDGITSVALVISLQEREGTGRAVGSLLLVTMLPSVFAPLTGALVDRFDRRQLLVACEYMQAVLGAVIVVWLPALGPLLALVFVKSIAATLSDISGRSAIPELVAGDSLVSANAWFGGARQAADVLGPLLGGVIVAAVSVRAAITVDVVTFLIGIPLLLRIPPLLPHRDHAASGQFLRDARAGVRYLAGNGIARAVAVGFFILGLSAADDVALPFLARELGAGDVGIGVLYAAVALGLVLGFAVLARGRVRLTPAAGFVAGCFVVGLGEAVAGIAGAIALAVAFQLVRGVGTAAVDVNLQTLLQRSVPQAMLGRVLANVYGAVGIAAAISTGIAGPLVDATSPGTVLVLSGVAACTGGGSAALLLRRTASVR
jgi:MFS family permease